jgi:type I restriction enzyme R subunit
MTTRLAGPDTTFLPFNQGDDGGAGNPAEPAGGTAPPTSGRRSGQRESWLEILGRYLVARATRRSRSRRDLPALPPARRDAQAGGGRARGGARRASTSSSTRPARARPTPSPGPRTSWPSCTTPQDQEGLRHRARGLRPHVIDASCRRPSSTSSARPGVVATIKGEGGSKSKELAEALSAARRSWSAPSRPSRSRWRPCASWPPPKGKRFAVIADEAHSSQTGEAAAKLKEVLSAEELAELDDGGEVSAEDMLAAQMAPRADDAGITFVAFTATPKNKTLELFGTRPTRRASPPPTTSRAVPRLLDAPGHRGGLHPRRAEELHALQAGVQAGARGARTRRQGGRALRGPEGHHGLGAAAPVQHRAEGAGRGRALPQARAPLLGGQGQGDGGGGSRKEAVRWQLAIDKYIADHGYKIGTLVAFSGEVIDPESGPDPFTETAAALNPGSRGATSARPSRATTTRSCWWPTSSRPASTSRCCAGCTSTSGWRASRPCRRCRA